MLDVAVLDQQYTIMDQNGVPAYRVVTYGAGVGQCRLPEGPNRMPLGVTICNQSRRGHVVAVRRLGIATAIAACPIALGDTVMIADSAGRLKPIQQYSSDVQHVLGFAETPAAAKGDKFQVFLAIHLYSANQFDEDEYCTPRG